jgi:hypothetical protein
VVAGASSMSFPLPAGGTLAEIPIPASPVWDGMAAAGGKLYLALKNGKVLRLKP